MKTTKCELCEKPFSPEEDEAVCELCVAGEQWGYNFNRPKPSRRYEGFPESSDD